MRKKVVGGQDKCFYNAAQAESLPHTLCFRHRTWHLSQTRTYKSRTYKYIDFFSLTFIWTRDEDTRNSRSHFSRLVFSVKYVWIYREQKRERGVRLLVYFVRVPARSAVLGDRQTPDEHKKPRDLGNSCFMCVYEPGKAAQTLVLRKKPEFVCDPRGLCQILFNLSFSLFSTESMISGD